MRLFLAAVALAIAVAAVVATAWVTSPNPVDLPTRVDVRLRHAHSRPVALAAVPPMLRGALVATEDERFYRHDGVDVIGLLRALPYDVTHLSFAQGASTITEQVAKQFYLHGNDHTPWRKLQDAMVALKLESRYSKEQILAAYLNGVYFGGGAYGARAASERYFGVAPRRLGVGEAALLAGLIQAPSAYDPLVHPHAARERQAEVLRSLVRDGFLTGDEGTRVLSRPLPLRGGMFLAPLAGVSLAPGPAFVWSELALGISLASLGAAALVATRSQRFRPAHGLIAIRLASGALAVLGATTVIRSFRSV